MTSWLAYQTSWSFSRPLHRSKKQIQDAENKNPKKSSLKLHSDYYCCCCYSYYYYYYYYYYYSSLILLLECHETCNNREMITNISRMTKMSGTQARSSKVIFPFDCKLQFSGNNLAFDAWAKRQTRITGKIVFVFAPVQRKSVCFTWKGALEIRLLYYIILFIIIKMIPIFEGAGPEWYISSMLYSRSILYSRDIPFWHGTFALLLTLAYNHTRR